MNYRFLRAARAEHLEEVAFYESRSPGLGAAYLAEFEAVMARICANPALYPRIGDVDIRKATLIMRFPFHVICRAEPTHIVVLAIAHHRRRPAYWVERAGQ